MATAQASPSGSDVHCCVLGIPGIWAAKQITFRLSGRKQPFVVLADSVGQELGQSTVEVLSLFHGVGSLCWKTQKLGPGTIQKPVHSHVWWLMLTVG